MNKVLLAAAAVLLSVSSASAADLSVAPVLTKARPSVLLSYYGSGFYWGAHAIAETTRVDALSPAGSTLGGTFGVGGSFGGTVGFMIGQGTRWYALEAMASYRNLSTNAITTAGEMTSINSKLGFTQRVKFGGDGILAILNSIPNLMGQFPTLPQLPTGVIGTSHPYAFVALHEDALRGVLGVDAGRAWQISPGFGLGLMSQMGPTAANPRGLPLTVDVWAEFIPAGSSFRIGVPADDAKISTGRSVKAGISFLN
jgi:opacity protein-like surface antigen